MRQNSPLFVPPSSGLTPHRNALESCLFSFTFLNLVPSDVEAQCIAASMRALCIKVRAKCASVFAPVRQQCGSLSVCSF